MKRMTPPFRIRMILVETNIKINNNNNKFIYFVFPTSDEDIRMSTLFSSLLKLIIIYPRRGSGTQLSGKSLADFSPRGRFPYELPTD